MRFGFFSQEGSTLWAWRRLQDEGHEVAVYFEAMDGKPNSERLIGDGFGITKLESPRALADWVGSRGVIVFDDAKHGEVADGMRLSGRLVFGGGKFPQKLEGNRVYGEKIAQAAGIKIPPTKAFPSVSAAIAFAKKNTDKKFYFKSNTYLEGAATTSADNGDAFVAQLTHLRNRFGDHSCILQEKIDGVALSTAWYWNGRSIVGPVEGTIEHKKLMNDEKGPNTGCSLNVVWFYEGTPQIAYALNLDKVEELFRAEGAPPCMYDINAIVDKNGQPWFLEWTPRFGYDSEPTAQLLLTRPLADLYYGMATGTLESVPFSEAPTAAYSVRVAIPPYPWEHNDKLTGRATCVGEPVIVGNNRRAPLYKSFIGYGLMKVGDELQVADPMGMVGLVGTVGTNLEEMHTYTMRLADNLHVKDKMLRTDGAKVLLKDLKGLRAAGLDVPSLA